MENDKLIIGGHEFNSRFILGSGKYSLDLIKAAVENAGAEIITLALRRAQAGNVDNIMDFIPKNVTLLPNTSGARNADEAVRIARLSREVGQGANEVVQILALLLVAELLGGGAHGLDNDGNGALFAVIVVDGDGDALAVFIHPQDDELAGLCLPGNHRSLDLIQDHGGFQRFFGHDAIHGRSFFPNS